MNLSTYICYRHILFKYEVTHTVTGTHVYIYSGTVAQNDSRVASLSDDGGVCTTDTYTHSLFHL